MAREPPAILSGSELRDLSLQPTTVRSAKITIIHPQLRDLILPLERGRVLYPRGHTVEEVRWSTPDVQVRMEEAHKGGITGGTRPFLNLKFTPNCLTARGNILACGGQHGELYVTTLPSPSPTSTPPRSRSRSMSSTIRSENGMGSGSGSGDSGRPPSGLSRDRRTKQGRPRKTVKPFALSTTLPSRSINNSMLILPSWPHEWRRHEAERKAGFICRSRRHGLDRDDFDRLHDDEEDEAGDVDEEYDETDVMGDDYMRDGGPHVEARSGLPRRHGLGQDVDEDDSENEVDEDEDEDEDEEEDDDDDDDEDEDEDDEEDSQDDEADLGMDVDDDDEETFQVGSPTSSVATYPNTVPFLHEPRIPHLSPTRSTHDISSSSRRTGSFNHTEQPRFQPVSPAERSGRLSFSHSLPNGRPGQPPVQVVTSLPVDGPPVVTSPISPAGRVSRSSQSHRSTLRKVTKLREKSDEPRLLISNNDQSIKTFALRSAGSTIKEDPTATSSGSYESRFVSSGIYPTSTSASSSNTNAYRADQTSAPSSLSSIDIIPSGRRRLPPQRPSSRSQIPLRNPPGNHPPRGSGFAQGSIAMMQAVEASTIRLPTAVDNPLTYSQPTPERSTSPVVQLPSRRWHGSQSHQSIRSENHDERLEYTLVEDTTWEPGRLEFERRRRSSERNVGVDVAPSATTTTTRSRVPRMGTLARSSGLGLGVGIDNCVPPPALGKEEERKLIKLGGAQFKLPINHSSLSPDLKTMVTVGDSTDVFLHQVIDGGREFRRIAVYSAATDYGFSTAWSKDGRKFAVASQDGQVTVWDHRASRPLAIFHSSTAPSSSSPSFTTDMLSNRLGLSSSNDTSDWELPDADGYPMLVDPVTGEGRHGSSTSGREAARVVKFSPEGSERDLLVFSEENTNIHIIDAKTFETHVVLPVPIANSTFTSSLNEEIPRRRAGVESGTWGIAGIAFDPTGDWLYSGTERSVVEWDLRRYGGGEGGTWGLR